METKKPWESKELWVNFVMGALGVVAIFKPDLKDVVTPERLMTLFAVVNMVLRTFFTKSKIEFK